MGRAFAYLLCADAQIKQEVPNQKIRNLLLLSYFSGSMETSFSSMSTILSMSCTVMYSKRP